MNGATRSTTLGTAKRHSIDEDNMIEDGSKEASFLAYLPSFDNLANPHKLTDVLSSKLLEIQRSHQAGAYRLLLQERC